MHAHREMLRVLEWSRHVHAVGIVVAQHTAHGRRRDLAATLREQRAQASPAGGAEILRHTRLLRIRVREIESSAFRGPPATLDRERGHVGRAASPLGADAEPVRDVRRVAHRTCSPMASRRLEDPGPVRVRDHERIVVGPLDVALARSTLSVALDQTGDHVERLVRIAPALEAEPHEIHAEQARRSERFLREHHLVADGDAMLVHAVLEPPEPVRLRSHHGRRLGGLRDGEVLAAQRAARRMLRARDLHDALALVRRTIAVLAEQRDAVPRDRAERHQRVAAHRAFESRTTLALSRCSYIIGRLSCRPVSVRTAAPRRWRRPSSAWNAASRSSPARSPRSRPRARRAPRPRAMPSSAPFC
jgi:hypothetical protein